MTTIILSSLSALVCAFQVPLEVELGHVLRVKQRLYVIFRKITESDVYTMRPCI